MEEIGSMVRGIIKEKINSPKLKAKEKWKRIYILQLKS